MSETQAQPMSALPELHVPAAPANASEPLAAVIVGAVAGALAFALCALWLGALTGIFIAVACAAVALERRRLFAAAIFALSAALCALALLVPTIPIVVGGCTFGAALAAAARTRFAVPAVR
jgi:hypothetical protein